jgi:transposase
MRGDDNQQEGMFSYISPEKRVPADHPLRAIRKMADEILKEMSPQFAKLYSEVGRPSIAPERLFRSLLLQIFYSVRSERMFDRATPVQPAVSVVCGDGDGRGGLESRGVQQESGVFAERGNRRGIFPTGAGTGETIHVG